MSPRDRAVRLLMLYNRAVETENSTLSYEPRCRGFWTRWRISWRWATLSVATALAVTIFYYHRQLYDRLFYAYWQRQCEKYVMPEGLPLYLTFDHPRFAELSRHPDYSVQTVGAGQKPTSIVFKPRAWEKLQQSYRGWQTSGPTVFLGQVTAWDSSKWTLHAAFTGAMEGGGGRPMLDCGVRVTIVQHSALIGRQTRYMKSTTVLVPQPDLRTLSIAQRDPVNPDAIILKYSAKEPPFIPGESPREIDVVLKLEIDSLGRVSYTLSKHASPPSNANSLTPSTSPSTQPSPH